MKSLSRLVLALAALVALLFAVHPASAVTKGTISSRELSSLVSGSDAKVVVLNFWSTWCGPCRKEIPGLIEMRWDYPETDVMIVGISLDYNPQTVGVFDEKLGINYPVYIADQDVMEDYEVSAIPKLMVYDRDGLVEVHEGYMPTRVLRKIVDRVLADGVGAGEDTP